MKPIIWSLALALIATGAAGALTGHCQQDADKTIGINQVSELMGKPVKNPAGNRLGVIEGLAGSKFQVHYLIVSDRGSSERLVPIPSAAAHLRIQENVVIMSIDREQFGRAPAFPKTRTPDFDDAKWRQRLSDYYRVPSPEPSAGYLLIMRQ